MLYYNAFVEIREKLKISDFEKLKISKTKRRMGKNELHIKNRKKKNFECSLFLFLKRQIHLSLLLMFK